jgi:hypothetical protein
MTRRAYDHRIKEQTLRPGDPDLSGRSEVDA